MCFASSIPDTSCRCQLLHGMASGGLDNALYVVASLRQIIRVVRIRISPLIRGQYLSVLGDLGRKHLDWIEDGVVPPMEFKAGSHAVDQHSVQTTLDLWIAMTNMIFSRRRPLPAGRHLLPEIVASWNRGKGPIDVYSRFQKNSKSAHSRLGPVGAIWMRLIMTTVYNAYHSFNLSRTAAFLASNECESFKQFQRIRARQPPFRQFCQLLAIDLTVTVSSALDYSTSDSDSENESADDEDGSQPEAVIIYNTRDAFFSVPSLIALRQNRRIAHDPSSSRRQRSCVWCCRLDHSAPATGSQKHCRHGRKTTWICSACGVPLCKVNRYNGQSCFVLFHEADTLFDPCCTEAQEHLTVRPHNNRALPPPPSRNVAPVSYVENVAAVCESKEEDEFIPTNSSGDDDDESAKRPATRQRTAILAIAVPKRRTRRNFYL